MTARAIPQGLSDDLLDVYRKIVSPDVPVTGNELGAAILGVLAIHKPLRIFDECDHHHDYTADGKLPEGVQSIESVGLVCEDGYQYSICWSCCTLESSYQTEHCADVHPRSGPEACWPCPTVRAIAEGLNVSLASAGSGTSGVTPNA